MSIVTSEKMLLDAQAGGYAIGAFNAENMEMVQAIIAAAEEANAPVMIQTTPSTVKYASCELYAANVIAAAKNASVPVCVHLDHGNSFALCMSAIKAGYTSVMIDGSQKSFEENVALTRSVVEVASCMGLPVEAELGTVGGTIVQQFTLLKDLCRGVRRPYNEEQRKYHTFHNSLHTI